MNRIQKFFQQAMGISNDKDVIIKRPPEPLVAFTPNAGYGMPERPSVDSEKQLQMYRSYVFRCTNTIANAVSNVKLRLYSNKGGTIQEKPDHPVMQLLNRVNPVMTFYDLIRWTYTLQPLTGECFWWKILDKSGEPVEIYPFLLPHRMDVVPDEENFIKGYLYHVPGRTDTVPFDFNEIIHFKYYTDPQNPYRGISAVKAAEYAISTDREAMAWNWRFFKNSALPKGVLKIAGRMGQDQFERLKQQWDAQFKGSDNAHRIAIIDGADKGTEFQDIGMSQKDMDFIQLRNLDRDEIFTIFEIPKAIIVSEESNRAVAEVAYNGFIRDAIVPRFKQLVGTLNEFLLPHYRDDSLFFDYDDPMAKNVDQDLKIYQSGLTYGWLSPNEVRREEGYEPFDGGDQIFVGTNMAPIGSAPVPLKTAKLNTPEPMSYEKRVKELLRTPDIQRKVKILVKLEKKKSLEATVKSVQRMDNKSFLDYYAKEFVAIEEREEQLFKQRLLTQFAAQEQMVLASLNNRKSAIKTASIIFDVRKEAVNWEMIFTPILLQVAESHGQDMAEFLGVLPTFRTTEAVRQFIQTRVQRFSKLANKTTDLKLRQAVAEGIANHESTFQIGDRIREVFRQASVTRSDLISRTEVSRAANFGALDAYKQSKVVQEKMWVTALDERTCPYCAPLHGKSIDTGDNFFDKGERYRGDAQRPLKLNFDDVGAPPLHPQCRCTTIPIIPEKSAGNAKIRLARILQHRQETLSH